MHFVGVNGVHSYNRTDTATSSKKSHFILVKYSANINRIVLFFNIYKYQTIIISFHFQIWM